MGPVAVRFETGWGSFGILDWWSVIIAVEGGSAPGVYQNSGTAALPRWKECQLQSADVDQNLSFGVSSTGFSINLVSGGCSDGMIRLGDFAKITNVFVLMLENHSFDNMFGQSGIPDIIHASPANANVYNGTTYAVGGPAPVRMPTDPGHEFQDVVEQLAGPGAAYPPGGPYPAITTSGYAANYATSTTEGPVPPGSDIGDIMLGFDTPTQLPVIYQLATEFALCDQWFSSLPGPTWPNRFFVHGASSAGLDHSPSQQQMTQWELPGFGFSYPHGSIFDALSGAGLSWRLYCDDTDAYSDDPQDGSVLGRIPQVSALQGITLLDVNSLTHFAADLQNPYTYQYTFIEPNYGDIVSGSYRGGSSQHPMDDVYGGEGLIKAVYEAIRNSPVWNTSLLIITYDEHGGYYDSVAPGAAVPPGDGSPSTYNQFGFTFDRLGVRVPAVVVSPWIGPATVDHTSYDHASVLATIERLFGLPPLTGRDAAASDVRALLALARPRTDAPAILNNPAPPASRAAAAAREPAASDADPIPQVGNLPGFLAIVAKIDMELSAELAEQEAARERYASIRTRGQARTYIKQVMARADATTAARPRARQTAGPRG
ncbi:MAG TPA: alkaline phosphatase family protein [Streptosporangiaceae bacterium]|nr:alkaline phosphatase family protein [Streptosporangiaceae bacterium]